MNGVFDCKWTIPLASSGIFLLPNPKIFDPPIKIHFECNIIDEKIPLFPSVHVSDSALFITFGDKVASVDIDSGSNNWHVTLGFPVNGSPMSLSDWDDLIILGGFG